MPMGSTALTGPVMARPFRQGDEPGVLELLQAGFGEWPRELCSPTPEEFFRWKHVDGPNGPSILVVAEADDTIIGFAAYMLWAFRARGRVVKATRGVDLVVHPSHRMRGVSLALRNARKLPSDVCFGWGNPNDASRPGGLQAGRRSVTILAPFLQPRPGTTLLRACTGRSTSRQLSVDAEVAAGIIDDAPLVSLLEHAAHADDRLATSRTRDYLRWRYGRHEEYRAIRVERGGVTRGVAIFRCRRHRSFWASHVCELLVEDDDRATVRTLLKGVRAAAPVDLISCSFASRAQAAHHGFVQYRRGVFLSISSLHPDFAPDPTRPDSWALSIGDLELL